MSYNSNGYIMLDFSMLDFSRTNQIIDGIYQRVFEIVGTNKFVLILNAQSKTPLPACVSFVNSSYVIESFLYNFVITLDDNVRIENVSSDLIKDGIVSAGTTWSSSKIKDELDSKVNISSLSEVATSGNYDDLLNAPSIPDELNDLSDIILESPISGNYFKYDGLKWINDNIIAADVKYTNSISVADAISGVISKTNVDISFNMVVNGFSDTGSRILVFVPFPFLMANVNYNVDCDYVNLIGQGIYTEDITVDSKFEGGCILIITTTATSGRAYGGRVYIRVYT